MSPACQRVRGLTPMQVAIMRKIPHAPGFRVRPAPATGTWPVVLTYCDPFRAVVIACNTSTFRGLVVNGYLEPHKTRRHYFNVTDKGQAWLRGEG